MYRLKYIHTVIVYQYVTYHLVEATIFHISHLPLSSFCVGYGLSPAEMFSLSKKLKSWPGSRNPAGYCKDGYNHGLQLYCPPPFDRNLTNGHCNERKLGTYCNKIVMLCYVLLCYIILFTLYYRRAQGL